MDSHMTLAAHIKATVKASHTICHMTPDNKAGRVILMAHIVVLVTVASQTMQASHIDIPGMEKACHMISHMTPDNTV